MAHAYGFSKTPSALRAPNSTPSSAFRKSGSYNLKVPKPPMQNPFDKFSQGDFDSWIGNITGDLERALGYEVPEKVQPTQESIPITHEHEDNGYLEGDSLVEDSFAEVKARRALKGKDRDPREGPGLGQTVGDKSQPIEIVSDEEEENENERSHEEEEEQATNDSEEEEEEYEEEEEEWFEDYAAKGEESSSGWGRTGRHLVGDSDDEGRVEEAEVEEQVDQGEISGSDQGEEDDDSLEVDFEENDDPLEVDFEEEYDEGLEEDFEDEEEAETHRAGSEEVIDLLSDDEPATKEPYVYRRAEEAEEFLSEEDEDEVHTASSPVASEEGIQEDEFDDEEDITQHQPPSDDTSFPPREHEAELELPSVDIRDPWDKVNEYAEDYYSGGDNIPDNKRLDPHHLEIFNDDEDAEEGEELDETEEEDAEAEEYSSDADENVPVQPPFVTRKQFLHGNRERSPSDIYQSAQALSDLRGSLENPSDNQTRRIPLQTQMDLREPSGHFHSHSNVRKPSPEVIMIDSDDEIDEAQTYDEGQYTITDKPTIQIQSEAVSGERAKDLESMEIIPDFGSDLSATMAHPVAEDIASRADDIGIQDAEPPTILATAFEKDTEERARSHTTPRDSQVSQASEAVEADKIPNVFSGLYDNIEVPIVTRHEEQISDAALNMLDWQPSHAFPQTSGYGLLDTMEHHVHFEASYTGLSFETHAHRVSAFTEGGEDEDDMTSPGAFPLMTSDLDYEVPIEGGASEGSQDEESVEARESAPKASVPHTVEDYVLPSEIIEPDEESASDVNITVEALDDDNDSSEEQIDINVEAATPLVQSEVIGSPVAEELHLGEEQAGEKNVSLSPEVSPEPQSTENVEIEDVSTSTELHSYKSPEDVDVPDKDEDGQSSRLVDEETNETDLGSSTYDAPNERASELSEYKAVEGYVSVGAKDNAAELTAMHAVEDLSTETTKQSPALQIQEDMPLDDEEEEGFADASNADQNALSHVEVPQVMAQEISTADRDLVMTDHLEREQTMENTEIGLTPTHDHLTRSPAAVPNDPFTVETLSRVDKSDEAESTNQENQETMDSSLHSGFPSTINLPGTTTRILSRATTPGPSPTPVSIEIQPSVSEALEDNSDLRLHQPSLQHQVASPPQPSPSMNSEAPSRQLISPPQSPQHSSPSLDLAAPPRQEASPLQSPQHHIPTANSVEIATAEFGISFNGTNVTHNSLSPKPRPSPSSHLSTPPHAFGPPSTFPVMTPRKPTDPMLVVDPYPYSLSTPMPHQQGYVYIWEDEIEQDNSVSSISTSSQERQSELGSKKEAPEEQAVELITAGSELQSSTEPSNTVSRDMSEEDVEAETTRLIDEFLVDAPESDTDAEGEADPEFLSAGKKEASRSNERVSKVATVLNAQDPFKLMGNDSLVAPGEAEDSTPTGEEDSAKSSSEDILPEIVSTSEVPTPEPQEGSGLPLVSTASQIQDTTQANDQASAETKPSHISPRLQESPLSSSTNHRSPTPRTKTPAASLEPTPQEHSATLVYSLTREGPTTPLLLPTKTSDADLQPGSVPNTLEEQKSDSQLVRISISVEDPYHADNDTDNEKGADVSKSGKRKRSLSDVSDHEPPASATNSHSTVSKGKGKSRETQSAYKVKRSRQKGSRRALNPNMFSTKASSRSPSVISTSVSETSTFTQPSPTIVRPSTSSSEPHAFLHAHSRRKKTKVPTTIQEQLHKQKQLHKTTSLPNPLPNILKAEDVLTKAPSMSSLPVNSPVTRSHCRYHKISIPKTENGPRICFLVPGCSLTDEDLITEEEIVDHGEAVIHGNTQIVDEVETLDFEPYLFWVMRQLVGREIMEENEVFYLPEPGETIVRKNPIPKRKQGGSKLQKSSLATSTDSTTRDTNRSNLAAPSRSNSIASTISVLEQILIGSDVESLSTVTESETETHPTPKKNNTFVDIKDQRQQNSPLKDQAKEPSPSVRKRGRRLGQDATAYRPSSDDTSGGSDSDTSSQRKRNRHLKRPRGSDANLTEGVENRKLKKPKTQPSASEENTNV